MANIQSEGYYELTKKFIFEKTQVGLPTEINDTFMNAYNSLTYENSCETYANVMKSYDDYCKSQTVAFNTSMFKISSIVILSGVLCWATTTIVKKIVGGTHKAFDDVATVGLCASGLGFAMMFAIGH